MRSDREMLMLAAKAAKELGRRFLGLEINPEYCAIAEQRLAQEVLALA